MPFAKRRWLNDHLNIPDSCIVSGYRLDIFNRWGQLVFSTSKTDEGWDGTIDGTPCKEKGDIMLIR